MRTLQSYSLRARGTSGGSGPRVSSRNVAHNSKEYEAGQCLGFLGATGTQGSAHRWLPWAQVSVARKQVGATWLTHASMSLARLNSKTFARRSNSVPRRSSNAFRNRMNPTWLLGGAEPERHRY